MNIAVDAMGGDRAPTSVVGGAVAAARRWPIEVTLVGRSEVVEAELARLGRPENVRVVPATQVIATDDPPVQAVRRMKDASLVVGLRMLREGRADAFVSAGSTGALVAGGLLIVGRLPGVDRPALGTVLPRLDGPGFLLDVGANSDTDPTNLIQFAVMGWLYATRVLGRSEAKIGLLSNGTEDTKGSNTIQQAHAALRKTKLPYVGQVEGRDLLSGPAHVVVADGFAGNVAVKVLEGTALELLGRLKAVLTANLGRKLLALGLRPAFADLRRQLDYSEYGGGPLLGVARPVIKCHGSSDARAIENGIRVAKQAVEGDVIGRMQADLSEVMADVARTQEGWSDG